MNVDIERTQELLRRRAHSYFAHARGTEPEITQRPFQERSTYPLYLFDLKFGDRTEQVVVKFAPVFPENNEGQTEFFNSLEHATATRGRPPTASLLPAEERGVEQVEAVDEPLLDLRERVTLCGRGRGSGVGGGAC